MTAKPKIAISLEIFDRRRFNNSLKHVNLGKYIGIAGKKTKQTRHMVQDMFCHLLIASAALTEMLSLCFR